MTKWRTGATDEASTQGLLKGKQIKLKTRPLITRATANRSRSNQHQITQPSFHSEKIKSALNEQTKLKDLTHKGSFYANLYNVHYGNLFPRISKKRQLLHPLVFRQHQDEKEEIRGFGNMLGGDALTQRESAEKGIDSADLKDEQQYKFMQIVFKWRTLAQNAKEKSFYEFCNAMNFMPIWHVNSKTIWEEIACNLGSVSDNLKKTMQKRQLTFSNEKIQNKIRKTKKNKKKPKNSKKNQKNTKLSFSP